MKSTQFINEGAQSYTQSVLKDFNGDVDAALKHATTQARTTNQPTWHTVQVDLMRMKKEKSPANEARGDSALGNSAITLADQLIHWAESEPDRDEAMGTMLEELMTYIRANGFEV